MTKTNLNISPDHNKVYNDLIERSVWEEQGQIITLQLIGYSSLCHKSFLNSILTVLKLLAGIFANLIPIVVADGHSHYHCGLLVDGAKI